LIFLKKFDIIYM